jgi:hypothetical protein
MTPYSLAEGVTFLNCIRVMPASNSGCNTDQTWRGFSWLSLLFLLLLLLLKMPVSTFISFDVVFHSLRFLFSAKVQTGSGAHPDLYSIGIRVLSREQSGREVMLTAHLHLAPRLMSGAVPLFPPYAFIALSGTTLHRQI